MTLTETRLFRLADEENEIENGYIVQRIPVYETNQSRSLVSAEGAPSAPPMSP